MKLKSSIADMSGVFMIVAIGAMLLAWLDSDNVGMSASMWLLAIGYVGYAVTATRAR